MSPKVLPLARRRGPYRSGASLPHVAALAFTAALALAGCANGADGTTAENGAGTTVVDGVAESATSSAETVTVTSTIEPTGEPNSGTTAQDSSSAAALTQAQCEPSSVPVSTNAATIAPPLPGATWSVYQTGNLCGTLGYAELATTGGTGSSPTQLLLYNDGEFLGTGITCNALGQVTGSTGDSISVQYRWPLGNDSNASMSGRANVTFQWNGSSVDLVGDLPQDAIGSSC